VQSDPIILTPDPECRLCHGRGQFYERHAPNMSERLVCDCVMRNAPQDAESQARIDAGDYEIEQPEEEDFDADDLADSDDDYDPQERMVWDGRDEP
jgi:hypothetical protein